MSHLKHFEHLKVQLEVIKSSTNNFASEYCIGRGGFGKVYKGEIVLSEGITTVALKRLDRAYGQGDTEFWKEIMMLSLYKHENIVSLLGYCDDNGEKILVYEYEPKGSLEVYLNSNELSWIQRLKICIGAAHGLAYLHSSVGTKQSLLHRDIKSSNVLLDENWKAKISDFGLSKFGPTNQQFSFLFSNAVGTFGYCDPLYVETGLLTKESDVYSFGVVLFEVLCGRLCMDNNNNNNNNKHRSLIEVVRRSYEQNTLDEIIFSTIKGEINPDSLRVFTTTSYQCLQRDREKRPVMTDLVRALETALQCQLNNQELAISIAKQGNLAGAENLFVQRFRELVSQNKHEEAVELAVESPQGVLRTPDTLAMLHNIPVQAGQTPPILQYYGALLKKGKLNVSESLDLSHLVVSQKKLHLLGIWLDEEKLECSEELGDLVKMLDNDLAQKIYVKARATP